jgi:hypothetical protein
MPAFFQYIPETSSSSSSSSSSRSSSSINTIVRNSEHIQNQQQTAFSSTVPSPSSQSPGVLSDWASTLRPEEPLHPVLDRCRVQNKLSQRTYRERQRTCLAELEKRLAECIRVIENLTICNAQLEIHFQYLQTEGTGLKERKSIKQDSKVEYLRLEGCQLDWYE